MKYLIFFLLVCSLSFSCKKDMDLDSFWSCNSAQNLDSTAISNKIQGPWKWIKQACCGDSKFKPADKNIKVIFNPNSTFTVSENSTIVTQGNWRLVIVDATMWGLDLSSSNSYLYGRILFCDNKVLFNDSHLDGGDFVFEKTN